MNKKSGRISSESHRTGGTSIGGLFTGLFLAFFTPLALAQGQGSYGGYLGDAIRLVLLVGLLVVLVALFFIYRVFGGRAALVVSVLLFSSVAVYILKVGQKETQQLDAYQTYLDAVQSDCLNRGGETILARATGREKVVVRILGGASIPRLQKEVLLEKSKLAPDITFTDDASAITANRDTLLVDIVYSRVEMAGSLPDAKRFSTGIQVEIKKSTDGTLLAKRVDLELRQGFCLGPSPVQGIIGFMRAALNRPDIQDLSRQDVLPFHYTPVVARTAEMSGQFQKISKEELIGKPREKDQWVKQRLWMAAIPNCPVKEVVLSSPVAICGSGKPFENQLNLGSVVGIVQGTDSWFAVLQDFRGMRGMDAFRIEQRDFSGKPLNGWVVNFPFPEDKDFASPTVESVTLNGAQLVLSVNWKMKSCIMNKCPDFQGIYFQRQTIITASL